MNMVHTLADAGPKARREARRQAILDAARDLVEQGGFEALTLQRLAKRLGYAVGALYRYFPSKEALWAAMEAQVLRDLAGRLTDAADRARQDAPHGAVAAILTRVRLYRALPRARPVDYRLLSFAMADPRVLVPGPEATDIYEAAQPIFVELSGDLALAQQQGLLSEGGPIDRALILWSGLQGILQTEKLARVAPDLLQPDRLADEFTQSLLRAWGLAQEHWQQNNLHLDGLPAEIWS